MATTPKKSAAKTAAASNEASFVKELAKRCHGKTCNGAGSILDVGVGVHATGRRGAGAGVGRGYHGDGGRV